MRKYSSKYNLRKADPDVRAQRILSLITRFNKTTDSFIRNSDEAVKLMLQVLPPTKPITTLTDFNFFRSIRCASEKN